METTNRAYANVVRVHSWADGPSAARTARNTIALAVGVIVVAMCCIICILHWVVKSMFDDDDDDDYPRGGAAGLVPQPQGAGSVHEFMLERRSAISRRR